jgi:phytoene dehydrogenase-like protein
MPARLCLTRMSYDALVVGSGPNGLSAAITMAQSGWRVLVLEAAERAGGAVATEELTLPGFRHDTFSAVYPAAAASPVFARLPLERHGLRWVHPPVCLAHPLPDGTAPALYRDLERTVASLEEIHAGDGERWRAFAAPFVEHFDALRRTMLGGFPPLRASLRLAAGIGVSGMLDFTRLLLMSAQALGEELFEDDGTRAWLYGSAMHSDVPPVGGGSAIAAAYMNLLGHGAGLSRSDPRPPRAGAGGAAGAQREPARRGRRRRQLHARPGRLPAGAVARALPHARTWPVPGQRGDVPGWRRARGAGPRGRAAGADGGTRQAFVPH